ncbi:GNAT family N-acetyltransferase [Blautia sp. RD014234]|nr:GNAT family N-acetyltransferase [Blautia parvula]
MQIEAFSDLYEKYQDTDTSPATEPLEKILSRLRQCFTYYYIIEVDKNIVGALRVVDKKEKGSAKRISPIFILKKYRNMGIAQAAIIEAERIHGNDNWELDTILSEKGNCYLYEKMGFKSTGKTEKVNDKMTLVFYQK